MVAAKEHFPRFTPEEYFAWEEQQEENMSTSMVKSMR
jgi:hypothetical protein